ncbi:uncharacterized protein G2W53_034115 [Senna tora]|uniref:Uncharacterized protein n=1 Tax=Senna tora TaxID=362788 RepID=A0A834WDH3_9FABA|nr:uncharacterized protein G2W53_034115 [Senna tora]
METGERPRATTPQETERVRDERLRGHDESRETEIGERPRATTPRETERVRDGPTETRD